MIDWYANGFRGMGRDEEGDILTVVFLGTRDGLCN